METIKIDLPTLYGDHHVVEVRRILLALPGVEDVYASSCFQVVEVRFDPAKISEQDIRSTLSEAGYLGELSFPIEKGATGSPKRNGKTFFRHTTVYETNRNVVSFTQTVQASGRALWPCPGIGVLKKMEE